MFLGLEAEKPFKVCSTLRKILIKVKDKQTINASVG